MATKTISRRMFVLALLSTAISVVAFGLVFRKSRHLALVAAIVRSRLDFLKLDSDGLTRFAADYVERLSPADLKRLMLLTWLYPAYPEYIHPSTRFIGRRLQLQPQEAELITSFLLGSDFFRNAGGDTRTVRYVGYFDPYTMVCGNPFARLD